jgi:hypothetical protein
MGWSVGFDANWGRDIGYGVPAICDRPGCGEVIDRGLSYVCGGEPYGGERGCGLYFCGKHLTRARQAGDRFVWVCGRCDKGRPPYQPTPDTAEWLNWKLTDESWAQWCRENPGQVQQITNALAASQEAACAERTASGE